MPLPRRDPIRLPRPDPLTALNAAGPMSDPSCVITYRRRESSPSATARRVANDVVWAKLDPESGGSSCV
jgi:hypothetical protein